MSRAWTHRQGDGRINHRYISYERTQTELTKVAEIGSSRVPLSSSSFCDGIKISPDTVASSEPAISPSTSRSASEIRVGVVPARVHMCARDRAFANNAHT